DGAEKGLGAGGQGLVKPKLAYLDPAFQKWVEETQKLPAEKQLDAVSKKLMELNPGFDGRFVKTAMHNITGVYTVELITDNVTDISPLRALAGVQMLNCSGSAMNKGWLSD